MDAADAAAFSAEKPPAVSSIAVGLRLSYTNCNSAGDPVTRISHASLSPTCCG
jgi:hypothetical protein